MPNQIIRDIYVTKDVLKNPIHYVRGTDLIPIVMRFCDFAIPSGATARVFVGKPDGNAVYTSATIEGNTVTIDVTEQMFITLGLALMQVSIVDGDEELVTFAQPVMVEPNLKAGDFPESSTDITFLDDAIEQANEAVETATTAAQKAATAVQNANTAISKANSAIADVNEAVASMNANFANLAQVATINALQTTAKTVVGAINELNSNSRKIKFFNYYQGGVDVDEKMGDLGTDCAAFLYFGGNLINPPVNPDAWTYFSVIIIGTRAFAFSPSNHTNAFAFRQSVNGSWQKWIFV